MVGYPSVPKRKRGLSKEKGKNKVNMSSMQKKEFYFSKWGYTRKDFQKWGRKGGLVFKYASKVSKWRYISNT